MSGRPLHRVRSFSDGAVAALPWTGSPLIEADPACPDVSADDDESDSIDDTDSPPRASRKRRVASMRKKLSRRDGSASVLPAWPLDLAVPTVDVGDADCGASSPISTMAGPSSPRHCECCREQQACSTPTANQLMNSGASTIVSHGGVTVKSPTAVLPPGKPSSPSVGGRSSSSLTASASASALSSSWGSLSGTPPGHVTIPSTRRLEQQRSSESHPVHALVPDAAPVSDRRACGLFITPPPRARADAKVQGQHDERAEEDEEGSSQRAIQRNPLLRFQRAKLHRLLQSDAPANESTLQPQLQLHPRPQQNAGAGAVAGSAHRPASLPLRRLPGDAASLVQRHTFICQSAKAKVDAEVISRAAFEHIVRESGRSSNVQDPFAARFFQPPPVQQQQQQPQQEGSAGKSAVPGWSSSGGGGRCDGNSGGRGEGVGMSWRHSPALDESTEQSDGHDDEEEGDEQKEGRRPKRMCSPRALPAEASPTVMVPEVVRVPCASARSPATAEGRLAANRQAQAQVWRLWWGNM
jgi:hypothetical protein